MNWENLYSNKRTGTETITPDARSEYQRDFDRLIFCPGFRRLQNKTQVFALPGVAFVHNRLTHSLEVSSVGRSLGKIIGSWITKNYRLDDKSINFYINELHNVIAAACLAHDIGNPPFGHSGENAISKYFIENKDELLDKDRRVKKKLNEYFTPEEWMDLVNFEGNANGLRFLTHNFYSKTPGGLRLTYTTLAATLKYNFY
jgi:dGTPase